MRHHDPASSEVSFCNSPIDGYIMISSHCTLGKHLQISVYIGLSNMSDVIHCYPKELMGVIPVMVHHNGLKPP